MARSVIILDSGLPGLAEPVSAQQLENTHPLWASDMASLAPHNHSEGDGPTDAALLCGPCTSTMDVARTLVERCALGPWGSVLAPMQTAGRGQLRREWLSNPGNLLATLVCPPAPKPWGDLRPLVLGHLFAEALSELGESAQVKWPNDILCNGKKVAGMLVEERSGCILAGIGLNLAWAPPPEVLRAGRAMDAGQYHPSEGGVGPARLWRALVNRVETGYTFLLEAFSPKEFLTIFRTRMSWLGGRVLVSEGASVRYEAIVKGISEEGGLVLDRAGQKVVLLAGDVTPVKRGWSV